ncbi:hypothetical protein L1987_44574 [Smallanthus sonchifolius]|uniref:Uncharacterized protein n=1 Tax=Smallanthus sonchifolius TaxID=185202 RepID=A0ACB9GR12_9ASTR|nr:hypothetical protein L1987_44574 [Smallanthus sonchifolius]
MIAPRMPMYPPGAPWFLIRIANEQTMASFFSHVMSAIGGNTAGPGDAVAKVYINHEKKFAFVEMRSVEEASNADGIIFEHPGPWRSISKHKNDHPDTYKQSLSNPK